MRAAGPPGRWRRAAVLAVLVGLALALPRLAVRAAPAGGLPPATPVWGLPGRAGTGVGRAPAVAARPVDLNGACDAVAWAPVVATSGGDAGRPIWALATGGSHDVALAGAPLAAPSEFGLFRGEPVTNLAWAGVSDLRGVSIAAAAHALGPLDEVWAASVGSSGDAYRSVDGGRTFSNVDSASDLQGAAAMVLASAVDGVVAAVTRPAPASPVVRRWTGAWSAYGDLTDLNAGGPRVLWDVTVGPDGRGWLAPDARGLWRLDDPAANWVPVGDTSLNSSTVMDVVVDPRNAQRMLVAFGPSDEAGPGGAYQHGVRTSVDGGDTWSPASLNDLYIEVVTSLAVTSNDLVVYAATWGDGLWRSGDGGATWSVVPGPPDSLVRHLANVVPKGQSASACELLFAGTEGGLFVRNMARAQDHTVVLPLVMRGVGRSELRD
jgi:hypothetical protein